MFAPLTGQGPSPREAAVKAGTRLRRLAAVAAAVAVGLLASVATVPAAFAMTVPPPGGAYGTTSVATVPAATVHAAVASGGMPGWQITLIAVGAALAATAVTIWLGRVRTARQAVPSPAV
jgi:hypothetical protein